MKQVLLCVIFIFSCWTKIFAQQENVEADGYDACVLYPESFRGCTESRISGGRCKEVIEILRASQNNDSIAIEIFKKEYKIVNMGYRQREWLQKKNYIEIIQYLAKKENEKYKCQSKYLKFYDPILLIK